MSQALLLQQQGYLHNSCGSSSRPHSKDLPAHMHALTFQIHSASKLLTDLLFRAAFICLGLAICCRSEGQ